MAAATCKARCQVDAPWAPSRPAHMVAALTHAATATNLQPGCAHTPRDLVW